MGILYNFIPPMLQSRALDALYLGENIAAHSHPMELVISPYNGVMIYFLWG